MTDNPITSEGGDGPPQAPAFSEKTPQGDDRARLVCDHCGFINYVNPKVVVGSVAVFEDAILLCRRAIEPRRGYWTIPAGYLEAHEKAEDGAKREAWEEARAQLELDRLLAVYSIPRLSQVHLFYRARLVSGDVSPGPESLETGLFAYEDIPWADIAFPSARWALQHYHQTRGQTDFPPFANPDGADGDSLES